jgi:hypothetical protein
VNERKVLTDRRRLQRKFDAWLISLIPTPVSDSVRRITVAFHALVVGARIIASRQDFDPAS